MLNELFNALNEPNIKTYIAVFILGVIVSFGSCTILEMPLIMSYLNSMNLGSKKQIIFTVLLFILGMLSSYFLIALIVGYALVNLAAFSKISEAIYIIVGSASIIFGLFLLEFIKIPLPHIHFEDIFRTNRLRKLGAFLLGFVFIFFEAPTCPSCAPALFVISGYMLSKGTIAIGVSLLMVYVLGQSVPLFFAATISGFADSASRRYRSIEEYVRIAAGIILVLVGLDLFWLA